MERHPSRSRAQTQGGHSPRAGSHTAIGRSRGDDEASRSHTTKRKSRAHRTASDPGEATYSAAHTMPNHTKGGGSKLAPPASIVGAKCAADRSQSPAHSRERTASTASASRSAPKPKEIRRKSRTASKTSPLSGGREEFPEACLWESNTFVEPPQQAINHDDREVLSYAQRRATVLAEQKYRESISYSNRRATQMAVAAATAKATGEEPKYLSYGEYRKTMSYAARRESRMRGSASAPSPTPSPGGLTSPSTTSGNSPTSATAPRLLQPVPDERTAAKSTARTASPSPRAVPAKATPQPKVAAPLVSTASKTIQPGGTSPGNRPYRPPPRIKQESSDSEEEVKVPVPKKRGAPAPPNGMRMF